MVLYKKAIALLVAICSTLSIIIPANALEVDPASIPRSDYILAYTEETKPVETTPPETTPLETTPQEPSQEVFQSFSHDVPLYFQDDYPNTPYGHGTVATSGCGIVCLAMVASYLTDSEYTPEALAKRFGKYDASNLQRMEYASDSLDIPRYENLYEWDEVMEALNSDKVVILMVGEKSVFTDSQHFIVLTGITPEGKIMVNDPFKYNQEKWELKAGYENGFSPSTVSLGFSGGWAYKKSTDSETADPAESNASTEVSVDSLNTVPLFYQNDYRHVRYGSGTIASSGCNVTSLAMVASYMTEHLYTPDVLADYFSNFIGNNMQCLEYGSNLLQLSWKKAKNIHESINALKEGKVVIALMNGKSLFTEGQHFIVLTGITSDGKIMVHDSNEANYHLWNLKNSFESGFDYSDILLGYDGAWIYDKAAMPEEPFIYEKEEVYIEPRYPEIELSNEDKNLLARMIWVESRGEPFEGQQAIAEVVLNRVMASNFNNTVKSVIYQPDQFNSTPFLDDAEPIHTQYEAIERALNGPYVLDEDVVYFGRYAYNKNVWGQIGGHVFCHQA